MNALLTNIYLHVSQFLTTINNAKIIIFDHVFLSNIQVFLKKRNFSNSIPCSEILIFYNYIVGNDNFIFFSDNYALN